MTHLAWMLFWISSGAKSPWVKTAFASVRCWGPFSHLCDEECGERVSSPPSHRPRSHDSSPCCLLCPRCLDHHQREHLPVYLWCRRKAFSTSGSLIHKGNRPSPPPPTHPQQCLRRGTFSWISDYFKVEGVLHIVWAEKTLSFQCLT